ncbi:MAG: DUF5317 domain-containing protein [Acidobacteriota bacterium]
MIILVVLAGALAIAMARGGKIGNLALLNIRWSPLILTGFLIQVIIFSSFWQGNSELKPLTQVGHLLSLSMLLVALVVNRRLPGVAIMTLGFALNFMAIALNGGYMPASPDALAVAGLAHTEPGQISNNSIAAGPETRLIILADIFAIPSQLPFHNVFSVGDVLIALGVFYLIQNVMVTSKPQTSH